MKNDKGLILCYNKLGLMERRRKERGKVMEIKRIDAYDDPRFSPVVLAQHGAFLAEGLPFAVEILSAGEAVISGQPAAYYPPVIEEFRFYAEHISRIYDKNGRIVAQFPPVELFDVEIEAIQPSQFYADADKVAQVSTFIHKPEDVVIPLMEYEGRYLSLDGHTRLYAANQKGFRKVKGFISSAGDYIFAFAKEAQARGVYTPKDLRLLSHPDYCVLWHQFCDDFFGRG